jgi:hypothetical protein
LYFAIHRHNEGDATYGIRVGSTRDLGFATGSVDMIIFDYAAADQVDCCVKVCFYLVEGLIAFDV